MTEKVALKEVLACVDSNFKSLWNEIDEEQRKALKKEFFILNRYVSNVSGQNREIQEHFVLTVNEFFNKHWNTLQKHPQLMWQLLCMCGHESKKIYFHQWMGHTKKTVGNNKIAKFLAECYPTKKNDEIEVLTAITSKEEAIELAIQYGYDEKIAKKMF